jgi:hypothetical protein
MGKCDYCGKKVRLYWHTLCSDCYKRIINKIQEYEVSIVNGKPHISGNKGILVGGGR